MCTAKILIIEDEYKDYEFLKENIVEADLLPIDFNEMKSQITISFNSACKCVTDIIKANYSDLRCIICDLRIASDDRGERIIEYIRTKLSVEEYPDYTKLIPIIAYTRYSDNEMPLRALEKGANVSYSKNSDIKYLVSVINKQIKDFSFSCDKYILKKPYKVAITFSGEIRGFSKEVAEMLAREYSVKKVFFDEFHNDKITGLGADEVLKRIYTSECEYVVLMISRNYTRNHWTGNVEWKAIRDRVLPARSDVIIPVLCDNFNRGCPNLNFKRDIVIKVINDVPGQQNLTPSEVAEKIINIIKIKDNAANR